MIFLRQRPPRVTRRRSVSTLVFMRKSQHCRVTRVNAPLIRPGHPPASVSNSKKNHNPNMAQLFDNYMFSMMVNIPSGMFTSFLANIPCSSVLMKKASTLFMRPCCIPTKKKKPPGQQKLTRTAQSSRNESVSSLSSSRETPIRCKKINPFLHPPAPLSQHRHNYSIRIKIQAEHRVSAQAGGLTVCCLPSFHPPASFALPSLTGHPFSDGPS